MPCRAGVVQSLLPDVRYGDACLERGCCRVRHAAPDAMCGATRVPVLSASMGLCRILPCTDIDLFTLQAAATLVPCSLRLVPKRKGDCYRNTEAGAALMSADTGSR